MSYNSESLDGVAVFASVVEENGFSAAAKRLGHSPSHVSKEVTKLEQRLGVQLLNRSTRSLHLTDMGRAYYDRCRVILDTAEEAECVAAEGQASPRGSLRVTAPVSFGLGHLCGALPQFINAFPEIKLDIEFNDRMVNIIDEGVDVAIRIGRLQDSSLIARKLANYRGVVVGAPAYWKQHGKPKHPNDLASHQCISYSNMANPSVWEFVNQTEHFKVAVPLAAQCNSAELETALCVAGVGVTRLPLIACEKEIAAGDLEIVLEEFEQQPLGLYAVYPHRAHLSMKTRAFIEFLENSLGG